MLMQASPHAALMVVPFLVPRMDVSVIRFVLILETVVLIY